MVLLEYQELTSNNMPICICGKTTDLYCAKCKSTFYCSKSCQVKDWEQHKFTCNQKDKEIGNTVCFVCSKSFFCLCEKEQDIEPKLRGCADFMVYPQSRIHINEHRGCVLIHVCSLSCQDKYKVLHSYSSKIEDELKQKIIRGTFFNSP
jgi:hypothetical protein